MDIQFPKRGGPINGRYLRFANVNVKEQEQTKNINKTPDNQNKSNVITSCTPPAAESSRCTLPTNPDQ